MTQAQCICPKCQHKFLMETLPQQNTIANPLWWVGTGKSPHDEPPKQGEFGVEILEAAREVK